MTTYYSEDHEWITVEGDTATVGITAHAAEQLGDIVFIELKSRSRRMDLQNQIDRPCPIGGPYEFGRI